MKHKHRIKPGYDGGEYKEGNVVLLSPTQHLMWHYAEWLRKGDIRDHYAYRLLRGDIKAPEKRKLYASLAGKSGGPASIASFKSKGTTPAQKAWILTSPSGEEVKVTNLSKFCRENGLSVSHLSEVASGHRKHSKGWKARRLE